MKKSKHKFSAEESKKIIDLLCEKYQLSQAIVNKTYIRTGFCPVKESQNEICNDYGVGVVVDIEYFAGEHARPRYDSVGIDDGLGYVDDWLSVDSLSLDEAYQDLADMIGSKTLVKSDTIGETELICKLPSFSSYEELAVKLAATGEN